MYHEEFYENRRTGAKTYQYADAVQWTKLGDEVYHWHHDGSCGVMK